MPTKSDGEHLFTVRELAAYMQVSERSILRMAAQGTLPAVKVGPEWRFARAAIDAWLGERMAEAAPPGLLDIPEGVGLPLAEVLDDKSIISEIGAKTKVAAIEVLAARASDAGWIEDKAWLIQAVAAREQLASTAMEG